MKRFVLVDPDTEREVLGGPIGYDNPFINAHGRLLEGKPIDKLNIGDFALKAFTLSGVSRRPTIYKVIRINDGDVSEGFTNFGSCQCHIVCPFHDEELPEDEIVDIDDQEQIDDDDQSDQSDRIRLAAESEPEVEEDDSESRNKIISPSARSLDGESPSGSAGSEADFDDADDDLDDSSESEQKSIYVAVALHYWGYGPSAQAAKAQLWHRGYRVHHGFIVKKLPDGAYNVAINGVGVISWDGPGGRCEVVENCMAAPAPVDVADQPDDLDDDFRDHEYPESHRAQVG